MRIEPCLGCLRRGPTEDSVLVINGCVCGLSFTSLHASHGLEQRACNDDLPAGENGIHGTF